MLILSDLTQKFYHTILWIFLGYVMLATSKRTRPIGPILYTITHLVKGCNTLACGMDLFKFGILINLCVCSMGPWWGLPNHHWLESP